MTLTSAPLFGDQISRSDQPLAFATVLIKDGDVLQIWI